MFLCFFSIFLQINAYLQQKMGFTNTHRLQGGIIAYNRELALLQEEQAIKQKNEEHHETTSTANGSPGESSSKDFSADHLPSGLKSKFRGVNYVFDERIAARITDDVLTSCELCAEQCDQFTNCANFPCNVSVYDAIRF